jgi:hypothetical protein
MKSSNKKINKEKNESKNIQKKKEESESDEEEQNLNEDKKSESKVNKIVALDSNEDINGIFCKDSSFKSIGVCDELCEVLEKLNYKYPTIIKKGSLPYALDGKNIIGLQEVGNICLWYTNNSEIIRYSKLFLFCLYISPNKRIMSPNKSTFGNIRFRYWT